MAKYHTLSEACRGEMPRVKVLGKAGRKLARAALRQHIKNSAKRKTMA